MRLENAAVLPVSISTAATALFVHLKLPLPSLNPTPTGQRVLIWGGSSSVGCSLIQLAIAAGLEVVTTASTANHDLMRSLGATHVFDHHDSDVSEKLLGVLRNGDLVVDAISTKETQTICGEILGRLGGGTLPVMQPQAGTFPENVKVVFGKHSSIMKVQRFRLLTSSQSFVLIWALQLLMWVMQSGDNMFLRHWLQENSKPSQIPS